MAPRLHPLVRRLRVLSRLTIPAIGVLVACGSSGYERSFGTLADATQPAVSTTLAGGLSTSPAPSTVTTRATPATSTSPTTATSGATPPTATMSTTPTTTTTVPVAGSIALTFDDGPVPGTLRILDILDEYGVKVTFFISAWRLPANAEIAREIVARGHSLQSHGYLHDPWTLRSSDAVRRDIERANELIHDAVGFTPSCVRPPHGVTNARTTEIADSLGMEVVLWSKNTADYAHQSSRVLVADARVWTADSVVLGHDTNHYLWTPVLGQIIEEIRGRNLEFVTICGRQRPDPAELGLPSAHLVQ